MIYSIVGMQFRNADWLHKEPPKDPAVTLKREPSNKYDTNAIQVWADDQHVGYIPKKDNVGLSKSMDKDGKDIAGVFLSQERWLAGCRDRRLG